VTAISVPTRAAERGPPEGALDCPVAGCPALDRVVAAVDVIPVVHATATVRVHDITLDILFTICGR